MKKEIRLEASTDDLLAEYEASQKEMRQLRESDKLMTPHELRRLYPELFARSNALRKELHRIRVQVVDGEYLYLKTTEQNGKDNPVGDGVDEFISESGAHGADGLRDDLNDSAWTTPIWFETVE